MAVSVRDVAREAGVSLGTVSNVLNNPDSVAPENLDKVKRAIAKLGYVRNDAARQLRAGRSRGVGVIVQDIRNPFFAELTRGAEEAAAERQLGILIADSDEDNDRERFLLSLFEEQRVLGVLVTPVDETLSALSEMVSRGNVVVIVDRKSPIPSISSVSVDDVAGGYLAVAHLLEQGCRRILFAGGPMDDAPIVDRHAGAQRAVDAVAGARLETIVTDSLTVPDGRRVGADIITRAPEERPDGVFAANDLLAIGIMQSAVMSNAISIPDDLALIGYDDISFAETAIIPLSSVRQPSAEIGRHAVRILLRESELRDQAHREQVVFQPALVVRDSTARRFGPA